MSTPNFALKNASRYFVLGMPVYYTQEDIDENGLDQDLLGHLSRTAGTRALLTVLFAVTVLLIARTVKNALAAFKTVRQWLRAQHSFYAQDGDPIRCTGWQFIGYNIVAAVVAILLCIEF